MLLIMQTAANNLTKYNDNVVCWSCIETNITLSPELQKVFDYRDYASKCDSTTRRICPRKHFCTTVKVTVKGEGIEMTTKVGQCQPVRIHCDTFYTFVPPFIKPYHIDCKTGINFDNPDEIPVKEIDQYEITGKVNREGNYAVTVKRKDKTRLRGHVFDGISVQNCGDEVVRDTVEITKSVIMIAGKVKTKRNCSMCATLTLDGDYKEDCFLYH